MGWKRGDVILQCEPYAHVLSTKHRDDRCSFCLHRKDTLKRCSACSVLRYCGRECQRQDWSLHREECRCLRRVSPNVPTDSVMLMLRLVLRQQRGDHQKTVEADPGLRTFQQLMSHTAEIQSDVARCQVFSQVCVTLSRLAGSDLQLPDTSQLLDIFGKMVINTFTIADEELQDIGAGVYLSASCLDHRCEATATVTFSGRTLSVRALGPLECPSLQQVSTVAYLSYVDQLAPSWERQKQLRQQYYFDCQCSRCEDAALDKEMTSGVPAGLIDSGVPAGLIDSGVPAGLIDSGVPAGLIDSGDGSVTSRSGDVDVGDVPGHSSLVSAITLCRAAADQVDHVKKASGDAGDILTICRECLAKVKDTLPLSNVYLLRVLDRAFDAAIGSALWGEALEYVVKTLQPYRRLLPPLSPALGLQLLRAGKVQVWLGRHHHAHRHLTQARAILSITHGGDGALMSQLTDLLTQAADTPQTA